MSGVDQIETLADRASDIASDSEPDSVVRAGRVHLTPNSAIQFLDFRVGRDIATSVRRRFFEDHGASDTGQGTALHSVSLEDGVLYHPVTGEPSDANLTYAIDGMAALAAFSDAWVPLPVLRVLGGGALDSGPTNWARAHISPATGPSGWRMTLALDTRIDAASRRGGGSAAPTRADVTSAARFRFASDEGQVAEFVTEAWIDDWIGEVFRRTRPGTAGDPAVEQPGRMLEHLAHYLTLLTTLASAEILPEFDLGGAGTKAGGLPSRDVLLVLDFGQRRTCALLHEPLSGTAETTHLPIRDLATPWRVHRGIFPSTLAFAKPAFGSDALSRWSGRTEAFYWPSLARIGIQADQLLSRQSTESGPNGLFGVPGALWDDRATDHVWRFCEPAASRGTGRRGIMLSGPQLGHVSETGELLDAGRARGTTTKPRFAPAALSAFFLAELITQAHAAINAPAYRAARSAPEHARRLAKIVVTPSARMHAEERARLVAALDTALGFVWPSLVANQAAEPARHAPPTVEVVADTSICQQIAYLESEIHRKFSRAAGDYFELTGQRRPSFKSGKSVRIATLDIGHGASSLAVATYATEHGGGIAVARQISDALGIGGGDIARAIADNHILPALARRLTEGRLGDAAAFVDEVLGGTNTRHAAFSRRFREQFATPIALAMLAEHVSAPAQIEDSLIERTLGHYFGLAMSASVEVTEEFDDIAADEGAVGFAPLETPIAFFPREIAATIANVLRSSLDAAIRVMVALDCDIVLLAGLAARLPAVGDYLRAAVPVRPDRIVNLDTLRVGAWYAVGDGSGRIGDSKSAAAVGASLLGTGAAAAMPVTFVGDDAEDTRQFVGTIDDKGCVQQSAILFGTARPAVPAARAPENQAHRSALAALPNEQIAVLTTELPRGLGARRVPVANWPVVPIYRIEIDHAASPRRLHGPFKLTLARSEERIGDPAVARILRASDAAGNPLDPATIRIRLCTDPALIRDGQGAILSTAGGPAR